MNEIIQNLLAFTATVLAVIFLVKKFCWTKTKKKKTCASGGSCGCH